MEFVNRLKAYFSQHHFAAGIAIVAGGIVLLGVLNVLFVLSTGRTSSLDSGTSPNLYQTGTTKDTTSSNRSESADGFAPEVDTEDASSVNDQLIIKTATLNMRVDDVEKSVSDLQELANNFDGFVKSSQLGSSNNISYYESTQPDQPTYATVVLRVPADRFDEAITHIKSIADKVFSEAISGQDVTEEYTDLQARLDNLQAAEAQLLELYERSGTIEEILKVQQQITSIRGQIEQTQGRMDYLQDRAKLSTITVSLTEKKIDPVIEDEDWTPMTAIREAVRDLITFGQNLVDSLTYFAIRWGLFIAAIYFAWKWYQGKG